MKYLLRQIWLVCCFQSSCWARLRQLAAYLLNFSILLLAMWTDVSVDVLNTWFPLQNSFGMFFPLHLHRLIPWPEGLGYVTPINSNLTITSHCEWGQCHRLNVSEAKRETTSVQDGHYRGERSVVRGRQLDDTQRLSARCSYPAPAPWRSGPAGRSC